MSTQHQRSRFAGTLGFVMAAAGSQNTVLLISTEQVLQQQQMVIFLILFLWKDRLCSGCSCF